MPNSLRAQLRSIVDKLLTWDYGEVSATLSAPAVFILAPPRSGSVLLVAGDAGRASRIVCS